jgi:hypothetical protein
MKEKIIKNELTYDFLKDEVHCLFEEKKELQLRIDKAIEYMQNSIETSNSKIIEYEFENILYILKGSKKNG